MVGTSNKSIPEMASEETAVLNGQKLQVFNKQPIRAGGAIKLKDAMMYATTPHMFGVDTQLESCHEKFCGWKKSCTSWKLLVTMKHCKSSDYKEINHLPSGAGFRNHPHHPPKFKDPFSNEYRVVGGQKCHDFTGGISLNVYRHI